MIFGHPLSIYIKKDKWLYIIRYVMYEGEKYKEIRRLDDANVCNSWDFKIENQIWLLWLVIN